MMRNFVKTVSLVAVLFAAVCNAQVHKPAYDGWSLLAPLPATNSETAVAELDGKIYVIGGYPADRKTVATVQMYDSASDKWQIVAALPAPLNHVMAATANGKVYAIGGQTSETSDPQKAGFVNTVYEYDPAANRWTSRAPMPTARGGGAAAVVDDKIYVVGGRPPGGADFAVYDPKADRWTKLPDLPTQRNHLAAGAHDGKVYVVGGRFEGGFRSERTDVVEAFDPKTNQWSKRRSMLRPRGGVNGIFANGCFHLFGGEGNPEHPYGIYPDHDYYNPVTDSWHRLENMPIAIHGVTGMAFIKGLIHLPGGGTAVGGSSGSTIHQVYKPSMSCRYRIGSREIGKTVSRAKARRPPRTKIRSTKSEARSSKQIQNDEKQTTTMLQTGRFEFTVLDFLILNSFWSLVCFGFRCAGKDRQGVVNESFIR